MATAVQSIGGAAAKPLPILPQVEPIRLEIFTSVPRWAIVHAVRDNRTAPLIRAGEVAVVESDGRTGTIPRDGGLYLIEYEGRSLIDDCPHFDASFPSRTRRPRTCEIVQTCVSGSGDGAWWAHPYNRPRSDEERRQQMERSRVFTCSDGPYRDEYVLAEKILGRVVGIYAPGGLSER